MTTGLTVVRVVRPGKPGELYAICHQELADRLTADAAGLGQGTEITDLGPDALDVANSLDAYDLDPGVLRHVGVARGGEWVRWFPPCPPEPVPGSPGQRGQRN